MISKKALCTRDPIFLKLVMYVKVYDTLEKT